SISGGLRAVHDTELVLDSRGLSWIKERGGRCLSLDDCARDDNGCYTPSAHGGATLPQTRSTVRGQGYSVLAFPLSALGFWPLPRVRGKAGRGGRSCGSERLRAPPPPQPSPIAGGGGTLPGADIEN